MNCSRSCRHVSLAMAVLGQIAMPCFAGTGATDARDDRNLSLRGAKRSGNLHFPALVEDLTVRSRARSHGEASHSGDRPDRATTVGASPRCTTPSFLLSRAIFPKRSAVELDLLETFGQLPCSVPRGGFAPRTPARSIV